MFHRHKTLLLLLKLNIKLKVERALVLVPMLHHDLQSTHYPALLTECRSSIRTRWKYFVISMPQTWCLHVPPHQVASRSQFCEGANFQLQFLIWISPLRGPKAFPIQKLSLSILVRVTQSVQKVSQTTFLMRRSWDRCWISLPSKLRVLLPFYIPWEAIDGPSFHKNHGKSMLA